MAVQSQLELCMSLEKKLAAIWLSWVSAMRVLESLIDLVEAKKLMASADMTTPVIAMHTSSSINVTPSSPRFMGVPPRLRATARQDEPFAPTSTSGRLGRAVRHRIRRQLWNAGVAAPSQVFTTGELRVNPAMEKLDGRYDSDCSVSIEYEFDVVCCAQRPDVTKTLGLDRFGPVPKDRVRLRVLPMGARGDR